MLNIPFDKFRNGLCKFFKESSKTDLSKNLISIEDIVILHAITKLNYLVLGNSIKFVDYWSVLQSLLKEKELEFDVEELINKFNSYFVELSFIHKDVYVDNEGTKTVITTHGSIITNFSYDDEVFEITFGLPEIQLFAM